MVVGLIIVAAGVFVLMAGRDALIAVWIDKLFDGQAVLTGGSFRSDDGLFKASQMADRALGHTLTIWFFLGLSPNPPKDTDGRREDSGRGWVRELQGRWPGILG